MPRGRRADPDGTHRPWSKGKQYIYAWRGGPRLHAEPGTPEFVAELATAQASRHKPDPTRIAGFVAEFRSSPDWLQGSIGPATRKLWNPHLDRIVEHFGPLRVAQFDRPEIKAEIRRWRDQKRSTPSAADNAMRALSRLLSYGVDHGRLSINHAFKIEKLADTDRSEIIWEPEELARLQTECSPELWLVIRLAIESGLRQDDCRTLLWSHVKRDRWVIEKPTQKSRRGQATEGRKIAVVPLFGPVRAVLDEVPRRSTHVLTNTLGRPWTASLSDSFAEAAKRAGVDKHFNDLRGTAATRLYLAGVEMRVIAEIMGWEEEFVEKIIRRYVGRVAATKALIAKLDGTGPER